MGDSTKLHSFPFKSTLNLRKLIEFWENKLDTELGKEICQPLINRINQIPGLREDIVDYAILEEHKNLIELLVAAVIPAAGSETHLSAAITPFQKKAFYATPAFQKTIPFENLSEKASANLPGGNLNLGITINACMLILGKFYGVKAGFDEPMMVTIKDPESSLDRVYKVEINLRFTEIIARNEVPHIDPHIIKFLTEKIYDIDLWLQYIKPEDFEFRGFSVLNMIEVTEEEMLSSIKYDLLKKDAVIDHDSFKIIQQKLRSIFEIPDLRLGIAYFDPNNKLVLNSGHEDSWNCLAASTPADCDYKDSLYERSWKDQHYISIEDLASFPYKTKVEEVLLSNGVRSLLLAPLVDDGETIGMLELAAGEPKKFNPISARKVENVLPMFAVAVKRVKSDMDTEVRALIQEECTAIHPSVQWRFFEAGVRLLETRRTNPDAAMEEIVFNNVYPLFGLVDIRNSSLQRNAAILEDLSENLRLSIQLLQVLMKEKKLPLLEELIYKTEQRIINLEGGLATGEELTVRDFLKHEINPVINHFAEYASFKNAVTEFWKKMDLETGFVNRRKKAFENSLNRINSVVGETIEQAEDFAQDMFPHYFEKYKTDGMEFTLYLGESLVPGKKLDSFFLRNFRLWQLLLMCEINSRVDAIKPKLEMDLSITQLILGDDQPVTIRFRPDEKQFDVDGAYDIRYEIVKKRIDKAYIKDRNERLTQPGKIAIVYSQTKMANEYKEYFKYLLSKGLIEGSIEEFDLEEMPGASGLKALRVTLAVAANENSPINMIRDMREVLGVPAVSLDN